MRNYSKLEENKFAHFLSFFPLDYGSTSKAFMTKANKSHLRGLLHDSLWIHPIFFVREFVDVMICVQHQQVIENSQIPLGDQFAFFKCRARNSLFIQNAPPFDNRCRSLASFQQIDYERRNVSLFNNSNNFSFPFDNLNENWAQFCHFEFTSVSFHVITRQ